MVNTFLPYPDFHKSAASLDYKRLGKQRIETKQIFFALTKPNYGWKNHPATRMWSGYEGLLVLYGVAICKEWQARGYKDNQMNFFMNQRPLFDACEVPWWMGVDAFHDSHKSNLLRKQPSHYARMWGGVTPSLPYFWPSAEREW